MLTDNILSELLTIRAHAAETQRLVNDMISKMDPPKKSTKWKPSEERMAKINARRLKNYTLKS